MAESLTSHEIEDVLSSVRRLVSEDFRPAARAAAVAARPTVRPVPEPAAEAVAEPAAETPARSVGRLILTASQRVAEAAPPEQAGLSGEILSPPEEDSRPVDLEAVEEAVWTSRRRVEPGYVEDLEGASREAQTASARGHWTAETVPTVAWTETELDWAPEEAVPFVAHPRHGSDAAPDAADDLHDDGDEAPFAEVAEAALTETVVEAAMEAGLAAAPQPATADTAPVDGSGLRDLVQQIIREELAGTLGERITRNVRKLVRIEVNRALASREFE